MAPTIDYQILSAPTPSELTTLVKAAIATGWEVSGNLAFVEHSAPYNRADQFYQAMVKTEPILAAIQSSTASIDSKTPTPST